MKCPNCEINGFRARQTCQNCGETFASQDLVKLHQLEFLLSEAGSWLPDDQRILYQEQRYALQQRLRKVTEPVVTEVAPVAAVTPAPSPTPTLSKPAQRPRPYTAPVQKSVPFDQWLLSERNIKLALYAGGFLLLLAGFIFIGVNWTRIPGPVKFAITLMITGGMYLGGFLLFNRQAYRVGGIALLGIASGFLALDGAVLQNYVLGPAGLPNEVMWLLASPLCLVVYGLTAYGTRHGLFTTISLVAVANTTAAALDVTNATIGAAAITVAILLLGLLLLNQYLRTTSLADFTGWPITSAVHLVMPLLLLASLILVDDFWMVSTLLIGLSFYVVTDYFATHRAARWPTAFLVPLIAGITLDLLNSAPPVFVLGMMFVALGQLGLGGFMAQREGKKLGTWPLYAAAFLTATYMTAAALFTDEQLVLTLLADVLFLAAAAGVFRRLHWVYGAVWLFLLPAYLWLDEVVPGVVNQGLLLGLLGLNFAFIGYILGQRQLRWGGPFLSAAALLTLLAPAMTWGHPTVTSLVLAVVAILYLLFALWQQMPMLLLPALVAVNVLALALNLIFVEPRFLFEPLLITLAALGTVFTLAAFALRQTQAEAWAWPLYIVAVLNLGGSYWCGLFGVWWLSFGLGVVLASLLLGLAWGERELCARLKLPGFLAFLGLGVVFVSHFYLMLGLSRGSDSLYWPGITVALCGLYVGLGWLLRHQPWYEPYGRPLNWVGLLLLPLALLAALVLGLWHDEPGVIAVTFGAAAIIICSDALLRHRLNQFYMGAAAANVVIWAIFLLLGIKEIQAYAIPPGLTLLLIGWYERSRQSNMRYRLPTLFGLGVLLGTAFLQSLPRAGVVYALLVLGEGLLALGWGVFTHSRGYVRAGGVAIVATAVVQLGPSFFELSRWIQIGITGVILLSSGLLALFKREEILIVRQRITHEWRQWNP